MYRKGVFIVLNSQSSLTFFVLSFVLLYFHPDDVLYRYKKHMCMYIYIHKMVIAFDIVIYFYLYFSFPLSVCYTDVCNLKKSHHP